jgi:hypothetical protein
MFNKEIEKYKIQSMKFTEVCPIKVKVDQWITQVDIEGQGVLEVNAVPDSFKAMTNEYGQVDFFVFLHHLKVKLLNKLQGVWLYYLQVTPSFQNLPTSFEEARAIYSINPDDVAERLVDSLQADN